MTVWWSLISQFPMCPFDGHTLKWISTMHRSSDNGHSCKWSFLWNENKEVWNVKTFVIFTVFQLGYLLCWPSHIIWFWFSRFVLYAYFTSSVVLCYSQSIWGMLPYLISYMYLMNIVLEYKLLRCQLSVYCTIKPLLPFELC